MAGATVDVSFEDNTGTPRFVVLWGLVKEGGDWKLEEVLQTEEGGGGGNKASPQVEGDYEIVEFEDGTTTFDEDSGEYSFAQLYVITDDLGVPNDLAHYYVDEHGYDVVIVEGKTATSDPMYGIQTLSDSAFGSSEAKDAYFAWKSHNWKRADCESSLCPI